MLGIPNTKGMHAARSIEEHEKILDALKQQNAQAFADTIEENILNGLQNLTKQW